MFAYVRRNIIRNFSSVYTCKKEDAYADEYGHTYLKSCCSQKLKNKNSHDKSHVICFFCKGARRKVFISHPSSMVKKLKEN